MSEVFRREHALHHRRRGRNLGVLAGLLGLVVMLFAITVVKMGGQQGATLGNPSASQAGGWGAEAMVAPFRSDDGGTQ
ncbi:MAG: hypothetical protein AAF416_13140 [Pseudomonadota bacterium]